MHSHPEGISLILDCVWQNGQRRGGDSTAFLKGFVRGDLAGFRMRRVLFSAVGGAIFPMILNLEFPADAPPPYVG